MVFSLADSLKILDVLNSDRTLRESDPSIVSLSVLGLLMFLSSSSFSSRPASRLATMSVMLFDPKTVTNPLTQNSIKEKRVCVCIRTLRVSSLLLLLLCNSNPRYCHPWEGFMEKSLLLSFHPLSIVFMYKVINNVYVIDD